jgi:hypothetical protein
VINLSFQLAKSSSKDEDLILDILGLCRDFFLLFCYMAAIGEPRGLPVSGVVGLMVLIVLVVLQ